MKLQYLGTAAFEGIPALFCECEVCREAKRLGGRNVRTRSQSVLDDKILLDFPADTYSHYLKYNLPMEKIKTCLITHSHSDHLYAKDMLARAEGFSHIAETEPLTVYCSKASFDAISKIMIPEKSVKPVLVEPFKPFEAEGYTITALNGAHDSLAAPYVYLIEKDGKCLLYLHDTDILPEASWEYLYKCGKKINLVSLDCTNCELPHTYFGHMGVDECIKTRTMLCDAGLCDENTKYVLNHFSHNAKQSLYDRLTEYVDGKNFIVSYDGMTIEF